MVLLVATRVVLTERASHTTPRLRQFSNAFFKMIVLVFDRSICVLIVGVERVEFLSTWSF
jgi:hypothetical protein